MLRLRILSLIAAVLLTAYNAFHLIWPMIALNAVIGAINVYYLSQYKRPVQSAAHASSGSHEGR
jgi:hypothetical protein